MEHSCAATRCRAIPAHENAPGLYSSCNRVSFPQLRDLVLEVHRQADEPVRLSGLLHLLYSGFTTALSSTVDLMMMLGEEFTQALRSTRLLESVLCVNATPEADFLAMI